MSILIVGCGNIGSFIFKELKELNPDIYDPFKLEYSIMPNKLYDFTFICVPTDMLPDGSCDTSIVEESINNIRSNIYIIKSTIPIGTTDSLIKRTGKNIVFSPEYYGTTLHSKTEQNFLILGGEKDLSTKIAQLYYRVKNGNFRIKFTDAKTAELAKYMENCFLALKVTFCCEFAEVAKSFGISYPELREIFIMDERMGDSHTFVYDDKPYYDSHCMNKDIPAFIKCTNDNNVSVPLMSAISDINKNKKENN